MKIYRNFGWFVIDGEYQKNSRKAIGGSLCPLGWSYPWVSVYLLGLYVCFRATFRLHRGNSLYRGE